MPLVQVANYSEAVAVRAARASIATAVRLQGTDTPIVRCGRAGAVWRVLHVVADTGSVVIRLEPVDPHDVPLGLPVEELPLPPESTEPATLL